MSRPATSGRLDALRGDATRGGREALRVISGDATDEEVVALVTALAAAASGRAAGGLAPAASRWADRRALLHLPVVAGRGAWAASAWRR